MNKHFFIAWIVLFVVWMGGSFLIHGILLYDEYAQLPNLYRTETASQQLFHWMLLAHFMMAGGFAWLYSRGIENRPWLGQGLRFGIVINLFAVAPTYLIYYTVIPNPASLVIGQVIYDSVLTLLLGLLVAFIYRNQPAR
ncbi:MAG: hypothetical protein Tsb002_10460 [Wenzhouxiangellaceae bacterium]